MDIEHILLHFSAGLDKSNVLARKAPKPSNPTKYLERKNATSKMPHKMSTPASWSFMLDINGSPTKVPILPNLFNHSGMPYAIYVSCPNIPPGPEIRLNFSISNLPFNYVLIMHSHWCYFERYAAVRN